MLSRRSPSRGRWRVRRHQPVARWRPPPGPSAPSNCAGCSGRACAPCSVRRAAASPISLRDIPSTRHPRTSSSRWEAADALGLRQRRRAAGEGHQDLGQERRRDVGLATRDTPQGGGQGLDRPDLADPASHAHLHGLQDLLPALDAGDHDHASAWPATQDLVPRARPSSSPSTRSSVTTSQGVFARTLRACSVDVALPTISKSGSSASRTARASTNTWWSSMMTTRMGFCMCIRLPVVDRRVTLPRWEHDLRQWHEAAGQRMWAGHVSTEPWAAISAAACRREWTPSLVRRFCTWVRAVLRCTPRVSAICSVV